MTINIWMQLLGFDRDDPDRGAARFLERTGFRPDNIAALLFHADFIHLHRGMESEYPLFPDNCAYYAVPRNAERARQPWTNRDLKELVTALKKRGVGFYAGIMGSYLGDMFHREWLSDHPELRMAERSADGGLCCLKRFRDGTWYEDFFAERLREVLADYGMSGAHLSDVFCPAGSIFKGDFSSDMIDQFLRHAGLSLPAALEAGLGDDGFGERGKRADWIASSCPEEWQRFYEWRWARFFEKTAKALHRDGREIWALGMYCTDPFETRRIYGFDAAKVFDAGLDCMTANILPTGVSLNYAGREYFFHRYHMDLPLLRAQVKDRRVVSMAGVQDASEEWSVLAHRPVLLERDLYTEASFLEVGEHGARPASDGYFLCLGDGLGRESWDFLKKRMDLLDGTQAVTSRSPLILWSDEGADRHVSEYFRNRRPSIHKQSFEIFKAGTPFGGCVRSEGLGGFSGALFVPNFDLLSEKERKAVLARGGPAVGTVPRGFDYASCGAEPSFAVCDRFSDFPLEVFTVGFEPSAEAREAALRLSAEDDGKPGLPEDPKDDVYPLVSEVPFRKLTAGFVSACGALLSDAVRLDFPVKSSVPMTALLLEDGRERLWLFNPDDDHYGHAVVETEDVFAEVEVAGSYPIQPVRFLEEANASFAFDYTRKTSRKKFQTKLAPGGVTVVDIRRIKAGKDGKKT